jgi:hypothetical protein
MNCAVGTFNNGKKIFLAAGKDADCYIYLLKMSSKKQTNDGPNEGKGAIICRRACFTRHLFLVGGDAENLRRRRHSSNAANGDVRAHRTDASSPNSHDGIETNYSDLEFTVQTIQSVQTDFR